MNSPKANLFLSLSQKISTLQDGNGNQVIKYVDQEGGQLEDHNGDHRPPVLWPCVLIDVEDFTYTDVGNNCQTGKGTVTVRLGFPPYSSSSQNTPQSYKEKAIAYYDIEQALHMLLQGWTPDDPDIWGALDRINDRSERRNDFIRVRVIKYSIAIDDYSTKPAASTAPAVLVINPQLME